MSLTDRELERYARQLVLPEVGGLGQQRLRNSKVAVVGAGGIGSAIIPALAGAGVGHLTIIDEGKVELANLHRQTIYGEADIGKPKADLAAAFARALNSGAECVGVAGRLSRSSAASLLAGHDLVIDGSDNFATRLAVGDCCVELGISLVSAAAIQFQGQVGLWLGHRRDEPCYRCFAGDAFDSEDCDSCADLGVLGPVVAAVGGHAALLATLHLTGRDVVKAGMLHVLNGLALTWRQLKVAKDPACTACSRIRRMDETLDERPVQTG